jgi:hypothetical protein
LITAWRGWLLDKLDDWNETDQQQFASAIRRTATRTGDLTDNAVASMAVLAEK